MPFDTWNHLWVFGKENSIKKPFIQNFSFISRLVIMITTITSENKIGWNDKIKDIFSIEPQNPKYDHSIIFDDNNLLWKEKSIKYNVLVYTIVT